MKELILPILWFVGSIIFTSGIIICILRFEKPKKDSDIDTEKNMKDIIKERVS